MLKWISYGVLLLLTVSCITKNKLRNEEYVFVEDFGAKSNDNIADDEAFKYAILYCLENNTILKLKNGSYTINKRILIDNIGNNLTIIGSRNKIIRLPEHGF